MRNVLHSRRARRQNVNLFPASHAQWTFWLFPDLMAFPSPNRPRCLCLKSLVTLTRPNKTPALQATFSWAWDATKFVPLHWTLARDNFTWKRETTHAIRSFAIAKKRNCESLESSTVTGSTIEKHPDVFEKRILFQWTRKYLTLQQTW